MALYKNVNFLNRSLNLFLIKFFSPCSMIFRRGFFVQFSLIPPLIKRIGITTRGSSLVSLIAQVSLNKAFSYQQLLVTSSLKIDTRHQTLDTRHSTLDTRHQTLDTRQQTLDHKHQTLDTKHQTLDHRYQTIGTRHQTHGQQTLDHRHQTLD